MAGEEDREMHVREHANLPKCGKCGHQMWQVEGKRQCPNCVDANVPKTGQTVIIEDSASEHGPVKFKVVGKDERIIPAPTKQTVVPGTITVHVPVHVFPDLVMWARKLKLPRDWKEAERIKAITDFQIEINSKLGEMK